jgi:hypothetical protein
MKTQLDGDSCKIKNPLNSESDNDLTITKIAAQMSAMELIIGTFFQSLHIPLTGHALSLNQGMFLCQTTSISSSRWKAARACYEVSGVACVFKSLAPSARKLGPMLSLMMQGLFYSLGVLLFGRGRLGQLVGFIFLSTWAFIQPLVTLLVSFGWSHSQDVFNFYVQRLNQDYAFIHPIILGAILFILSVKFLLAVLIVLILNNSSFEKLKTKQAQLSDYALEKLIHKEGLLAPAKNKRAGILKDLTQPLFLMSLIFSFIFLFVTKPSLSVLVWNLLRPVGIYLLISYCLRSPAFLQFLDQKTQGWHLLEPIKMRLKKLREYLVSLQKVKRDL